MQLLQCTMMIYEKVYTMIIDICLLRFCVHSQIAFVWHPLTVVMKGMKIHQVSMHVVAVNVFANGL